MQTPPKSFVRARSLRRAMTRTEVGLWLRLKDAAVGGLRFRKQHPAGPYILDFYCSAAKLAVELDGVSHQDEEALVYDARRDAWMATQGILTLRITTSALSMDVESVLETIRVAAMERIGLANRRAP